MSTRRTFLRTAAGTAVLLNNGFLSPRLALARSIDLGPPGLPEGTVQSALFDALPGKHALIKRSFRPPNYETPLAYLDESFTPNSRFFVRYHHAAIPPVEVASWMLELGGDGIDKPVRYNLAELRRKFATVEIPALCLCAGNRRGLFAPHVPGIQWGTGAMGNAVWRGIRLRDVLNAAGIKKNALEVTLDAADSGVLTQTPDFIKGLPLWKALDEHTLIAFEMNGSALPHWNGHPARLIVPGWAATYWVKHLTRLQVVTRPFDGFWMKTAYRIPTGKFSLTDRFESQETEANIPITELLVNSLITNLREGQQVQQRRSLEVHGLAWDGGHGIKRVELSTDGGRHWQQTTLRKDFGRFAWRLWHYRIGSLHTGALTIMARATNRRDSTQPENPIANPAGYHHNAIARVTVHVV